MKNESNQGLRKPLLLLPLVLFGLWAGYQPVPESPRNEWPASHNKTDYAKILEEVKRSAKPKAVKKPLKKQSKKNKIMANQIQRGTTGQASLVTDGTYVTNIVGGFPTNWAVIDSSNNMVGESAAPNEWLLTEDGMVTVPQGAALGLYAGHNQVDLASEGEVQPTDPDYPSGLYSGPYYRYREIDHSFEVVENTGGGSGGTTYPRWHCVNDVPTQYEATTPNEGYASAEEVPNCGGAPTAEGQPAWYCVS